MDFEGGFEQQTAFHDQWASIIDSWNFSDGGPAPWGGPNNVIRDPNSPTGWVELPPLETYFLPFEGGRYYDSDGDGSPDSVEFTVRATNPEYVQVGIDRYAQLYDDGIGVLYRINFGDQWNPFDNVLERITNITWQRSFTGASGSVTITPNGPEGTLTFPTDTITYQPTTAP